MKITNVKAIVAKAVTVSLLAGVFALAAPVKAQAEQFAVGVQFGYPHYDYYARRDYYDHLRFEQERRHDEWVRAHDRDRYRDHHDHDRYRDDRGYRGR
jgi:hypothetical protein